MNAPPLARTGRRPTWSLITVGPGWAWPAAAVTLFIALVYIPGHHPSADALDQLIASIAAVYVVGMSLVLVRLAGGSLLRLGGSTQPIVILGRAPETAIDGRIHARWRLGAALVSTLVAAVAALGSGWLAGQAGVSTYAHGIAALGMGVNLALAASIVVPLPGFAGWSILVALVDAAGTPVHLRIRRTARLARILAMPISVALVIAATALGHPLLVIVSMMLTLSVWAEAGLAVGRDTLARFLEGRVARELARPLTSQANVAELVTTVRERVRGGTAVIAIEANGALVGVVGPAQLTESDRGAADQRVGERMVAFGDVPFLPATAAANELLEVLAPYGFALVRTDAGLAYVEASDLLAQIHASDPPPSGPGGPPLARG